jgi:hypothetical protein
MAQLATSLIGPLTSIYGSYKQGQADDQKNNFIAAQYNQNANDVQGAGQRQAEEARRQSALLASRAQALAGGGAGDVSVTKTIADISAEGELRALTALYEGDTAAQRMRDQARAKIFEGGEAKKARGITTATTLFNSGSQLYSKYGGNGSPTAGYSDPDGFVSNSGYN